METATTQQKRVLAHPQLGRPIAVYPYRHADGRAAFAICRFDPKDFRPAHPTASGEWTWGLNGTPPLLYRLPEVQKAIERGETIWITDGEKDADALADKGVVATCCARAQGWSEGLAAQLRGAAHVRIVADRDESGVGGKQARETKRLLIKYANIIVPNIEIVEAAEGKDAHDHLAAGHGLDDFVPVAIPPDRIERGNSWQPVNLLDAALNPPAPPSIEGIVYPGRRHVFSGEPESLKSWALMCLYVAEMRKGNTVVHVDLEMGAAEISERLTLLGATHDQLATQFVLLEPSEPMTQKDVLPYVRAMLELRRPSIVGVDAFTGALLLHGCDPNSSTEVERFYRTVADELRGTGAAFVVLDHLSKNKEARGKFAIGSERKIGACDCHFSFEVQKNFGRGEHGKAAITVKKDRPGHIARDKAIILDLFSSPDTGHIKFVWHFEKKVIHPHGNFRPTAYMERVSRYLAECVTPPSAAEAELAAGGKAEFARLATQILVRDGFAKEGKNEHGERTLRSVRRYVETEDPESDKYIKPRAEAPVFEGDKDIPF